MRKHEEYHCPIERPFWSIRITYTDMFHFAHSQQSIFKILSIVIDIVFTKTSFVDLCGGVHYPGPIRFHPWKKHQWILKDLGACVDPREEEAKWVIHKPCERESMTYKDHSNTNAVPGRPLIGVWCCDGWISPANGAQGWLVKLQSFKERLSSASKLYCLSARRIHISTPWEDMVPVWDDCVDFTE